MHAYRPRLLRVLQGSCQIQQRRCAAAAHALRRTRRPSVRIGQLFTHSSAKLSSQAEPEPRVDAQRERETTERLQRVLPSELLPLGLHYLEQHELRERYDAYDADGSGQLEVHEVRTMLRDAGVAHASLSDARSVVASLDCDGNGKLSYEELNAAVAAAARPIDRRVKPIYASLTLIFASQGTQFPVLPQLGRMLELSVAELGLVASASALARMLSNLPASMLAERVGRRPLLIAGPAISAVGMAGIAASSSFIHLVLANAAVGVGMSVAMAGASLYLSDIATPLNRAQTTAPILQSALFGFAIGPGIGGLMAQSLGLSLPFVGCSIGLAGASLSASLLLPETMHEAVRRRAAMARHTPPRAVRLSRLLARPALQGVGCVVFMNGFGHGAMPITLVLYACETLQMSSAAVGAMLTANVCVMGLISQPATRLSDAVESRKSIMVPAQLAAAACTAAQPFAAEPMQLAVAVSLAGACSAVAMPSISPLILDWTSDAERAKALAMRQMAQDSGALCGAAGMGLVATACGVHTAMLLTASMQAAATIFFALRAPSRVPTGEALARLR